MNRRLAECETVHPTMSREFSRSVASRMSGFMTAGVKVPRVGAGGRVLVLRPQELGIATAVVVTVLGRIEFAVFASAYLLKPAPLLLTAAFLHRRLQTAAPGLDIAG